MADDLVLDALKAAIRRDDEILLVKSGKQAGLFKSRTGKANQEAMAACLTSDPPLLVVTREEKGPGKSKAVKQFARITDAGIAVLIDRIPPAEYAELLSRSASPHQPAVLLGCLQGARALDAEIERAIQTAKAVHEALLARALAFLEALNRRVEETRAQRQALDEAIARLGPPPIAVLQPLPSVAEGPGPGPEPPRRPRRPDAGSEDDLDYQRAVSQELVFAWRDAASEAARAGYEQTMINVGIEPIGEPDAIVPFDGTLHDADGDVAVGEEVEVVEPGWQLSNPRGVFTLLRARTRIPASKPPQS